MLPMVLPFLSTATMSFPWIRTSHTDDFDLPLKSSRHRLAIEEVIIVRFVSSHASTSKTINIQVHNSFRQMVCLFEVSAFLYYNDQIAKGNQLVSSVKYQLKIKKGTSGGSLSRNLTIN
jgi:hypothetical protein